MGDLRETTLDHVSGEDHATFYSGETKWINHLLRLKEQFPDEVDIRHVNPDGSLLAHIPVAWLKIKPKKKMAFTEEQIEASRARLENGRLKRLGKSGDDVRVGNGKE